MKFRYYIIILVVTMCFSCLEKKGVFSISDELFVDMDSKASGIDFSNILTENDSINYFNYGYMYMGGGVAIGDINNDGLEDIYFTGNMVENKLYLNKGELNFEDVTKVSGVGAKTNIWITGVTMADVNADGWLDIYVSVSGIWADTKNLLFVNKGLDDNNVPVFSEEAEQFGIADLGHSVQGTFFDYDNDGDLDLYVINYPPTDFRTTVPEYHRLMQNVTDEQSNTLYRNNGDNTFTDITEASGLLSFGLSLSAAIGDYNSDGWQDIYVSNDFASPDNFYFNNGDGTFTDQIKKTTNQTAFFGMGSDVADFNNDGLLDFFQLDMTPEDNRRSKANMQSMNVQMFDQMDHFGFHTQYMHNTLQLNVGNDENKLPLFSNIPRLGGVALTDWSWAALFADFDNDGWKDLYVTNGTRREINNKDYFKKIGKQYGKKKKEGTNLLPLIEGIPSEKIENYAFKNNKDLTFSKIAKKWGLDHKGFSNGAAYADLDNDGDLDLVVNNIDEMSKVYKNTTSESKTNNYLKVNLKGTEKNLLGVGAKVYLYNNGSVQVQQAVNSRGFQSAVPSILNFGVGEAVTLDSIKVIWPDGEQQTVTLIKTNTQIDLSHANSALNRPSEKTETSALFKDITNDMELNHAHQENKFDDYFYQVLLPNKMSQFGPALAVGDVNNDDLEDFYIGGASGKYGVIYMQQKEGGFKKQELLSTWGMDDINEDVDALFFDANNDGLQDLYVVSGGNEFYANTEPYQDRLYINTKQGFVKSNTALPKMYISGSKVVPADFDDDGDIDLFVGGRHTPRNYPVPTSSYILRNDSEGSNIKFTDVTNEKAPNLKDIGMVTDAVWTDFNDDHKLDLVIVGEWMPVTFLQNENGTFIDKTELFGFEKSTGWWNSIIAEDFDRDGDIDFVVGNLGLNYKYRASTQESFDVYADDYDNNGNIDIVLSYYYDGEQYPVRGRQCSSEQIPAIKIKFKDYNSFAEANVEDIYSTQSLKDSKAHFKAYNFSSSYIENQGNSVFRMFPLPNEAQVSSVNSIIARDINRDGAIDLILSGNLYVSEVETPRNDASYGLYLEGDGKGNFNPMAPYKSGLYVKGDVKNAEWITLANKEQAILFAKNDAAIQIEKVQKK
ncbi:VCBS repeat-containing protein [Seonamhaeicola sp.]|uniref:VCBS repeat-containing protein n=1 Tax=Seonamhaeicola sp. TaxID=1912245 RepID=UPI0026260998|nr:VCBS repeat-containing protein [Seonamhaeicola sp.]